MSELKTYRFRTSFVQNGTDKEMIVQGRSMNDECALLTAHVLADGVELCGGFNIKIIIVGAEGRHVGCVSDRIKSGASLYERQQTLGPDFES
jgi:hypothetical protein